MIIKEWTYTKWDEYRGMLVRFGVVTAVNIKITVMPPYPLIQYPWLQLSTVYRGPKKKGKLKKQMVHKFQNVCQVRTDCNMVKSSSPNAPSTWLIFLLPFVYCHLRIRLKHQNPLLLYIWQRDRKYTVNVQCSVQYTLLLLYLMLVMSYHA
jgi:hypothetical protein